MKLQTGDLVRVLPPFCSEARESKWHDDDPDPGCCTILMRVGSDVLVAYGEHSLSSVQGMIEDGFGDCWYPASRLEKID